MVAIMILNWNGWQDSIACLESLSKIDYDEFFVVLGDNGSTNNSKKEISSFCNLRRLDSNWIKIGDPLPEIANRKVYLYDLQSNYGFAKGNNILIQLAARHNPDYYLLLNNDTEVEPDFLTKLINYQRTHNRIKVLTPIIYYYGDKPRIWNAGGRLLWGIRKYHYADSTDVRAREKEFIPCSFITGCALFCTQDVLLENNKLFTESFFHGEEDFDFSLRMKDKGIKMGCVTSSVIYHKVGRSSGSIGNKIQRLNNLLFQTPAFSPKSDKCSRSQYLQPFWMQCSNVFRQWRRMSSQLPPSGINRTSSFCQWRSCFRRFSMSAMSCSQEYTNFN